MMPYEILTSWMEEIRHSRHNLTVKNVEQKCIQNTSMAFMPGIQTFGCPLIMTKDRAGYAWFFLILSNPFVIISFPAAMAPLLRVEAIFPNRTLGD